jgi:hypothetical protein
LDFTLYMTTTTTIIKIQFEDDMGQEYERFYSSYQSASTLLGVTIENLKSRTNRRVKKM